jgi:hypothetical protein
MKALILKAANHMKYPTSWQGLFVLLTSLGVSLAPEFQAVIVSVGAALFGAVAFFFSDADVVEKKKK